MNPNVLDEVKINGPDNTTTVSMFPFTNQVVPGLFFLLLVGFFVFAQEVCILRSQLVSGRKASIREALSGQFHPQPLTLRPWEFDIANLGAICNF